MLLYVYIHEHFEAKARLTGVQGSVRGQLFCSQCFTLLYLTRSAFVFCLFTCVLIQLANISGLEK